MLPLTRLRRKAHDEEDFVDAGKVPAEEVEQPPRSLYTAANRRTNT